MALWSHLVERWRLYSIFALVLGCIVLSCAEACIGMVVDHLLPKMIMRLFRIATWLTKWLKALARRLKAHRVAMTHKLHFIFHGHWFRPPYMWGKLARGLTGSCCVWIASAWSLAFENKYNIYTLSACTFTISKLVRLCLIVWTWFAYTVPIANPEFI